MGARIAVLRICGPKKDDNLPGGLDKTVVTKDIFLDEHYRIATQLGYKIFLFAYLLNDVDGQASIAKDAIGSKVFCEIFCDAEEGDLDKGRIDRFCLSMDTKLPFLSGYRGRGLTGVYANEYQIKKWKLGNWIGQRPFWPAEPGVAAVTFGPHWLLWQDKQIVVDGMVLDHNVYYADNAQLERDYPADGSTPEPGPGPLEPTEGEMDIFDLGGEKKDWSWVQGKYGNVVIEPAALPAYCVVGLREITGPSILRGIVLDKNGKPVLGQKVCYDWIDEKTGLETLCGLTDKTDGGVEFGLGTGSYYFPDQGKKGPHRMQVSGISSERACNLGLLPGTEHTSLEVTFQWKETIEPVPPEPEPEPEPEPQPEPPQDNGAELIRQARVLLDEWLEKYG